MLPLFQVVGEFLEALVRIVDNNSLGWRAQFDGHGYALTDQAMDQCFDLFNINAL